MTIKITVPDHAESATTKAYVDQVWRKNPRISPDSWRIVEGLTVGKCAFSGPISSADHLKQLFVAGTNLYLLNAETADAFGTALRENIQNGIIDRRCIVIIAQAGLIHGSRLAHWQQNPAEGTIQMHDDLWHCMHPAFLEAEFAYIHQQLGVDVIDGILLQDPEYTCAALPNKTLFYQQLEAAFTLFETQVKEGKSLFYGLCSNTLTMFEQDVTFIDLALVHEQALAAAQKAWDRRKRPAFRALAMPFNLLETSAIHNTNTTAKIFEGVEAVSTLELAARMHLSVFATRPLHAFIPGQGVLPLRPATNQPELIKNAQNALLGMLEKNLTPSWKGANLPAIALNAAASTPGISCVVDYFKEEYIEENTSVYERGNFPDPLKFIENS